MASHGACSPRPTRDGQSPHQLPPHGDTYFPAWIPSQVDDSFIRIRSLLIPASLYRSMRRWARATIASLSKESLRGRSRDSGARQPARGCVACPARSSLAGLIFEQGPEASSSRGSAATAAPGRHGLKSSCCPRPTSPVSPASLPCIHFCGYAAWNFLQYFCSKQHKKFISSICNLFLS